MHDSSRRSNEWLLFWASFSVLFFEVMLIRWLSAEVRVFSYFHNLVLLFCYLGIGLGVARPSAQPRIAAGVGILALLVLLISLSDFLGAASFKNASEYLSRLNDMPIWYRSAQPRWYREVAELAAGTTMVLIMMAMLTAVFVPIGQLIGHHIDAHRLPLRAYGINLAGSLGGILCFYVLSAAAFPPETWIAVGALALTPLVWRRPGSTVACGVAVAAMIAVLYPWKTTEVETTWSPYQKLTVQPIDVSIRGESVRYGHAVLANGVGYMAMANYSSDFMGRFPDLYPAEEVPYDHYNVAYRFADRLDHVLIVGAGTGNDVAGALRNGAAEVTAVEIDPEIVDIGRRLHPERPYADPRVRVINDDARSFFKKSSDRYDLIVFGLLDSMTLSSSFSNVRLDNYVYTVESFREARRLLNPSGVVVVLFEVEDDFIGARIQRIIREAFGEPPTGFLVRSGLRGWGGYGFVAGDPVVINAKLATDRSLNEMTETHASVLEAWEHMTAELTTDDWPFLYLRSRKIPTVHVIVFGILTLCSFIGIRRTLKTSYRFDRHFFLLGAGFMLLEVQNISKLALLFGNTWTVSAVVIVSVLSMALIANCVAMHVREVPSARWYYGLFAALILCFLVPITAFSDLSMIQKALAAGFFYSLPIFFSGMIFSTSFARCKDHSSAMSSNLFGATVGGMLESLAFLTGTRSLLIVAAILYVLSSLGLGERVMRSAHGRVLAR